MNGDTTINIILTILFFGPISLWALIFFTKPKLAIAWTDKFSKWVERKKMNVTEKNNFTSKYVLKPFFWVLYKIMVWTEQKFSNKSLRSGIRVILTSCAVTCFALLIAFLIIIFLYLTAILIFLFPLIGIILLLIYLSHRRSVSSNRRIKIITKK